MTIDLKTELARHEAGHWYTSGQALSLVGEDCPTERSGAITCVFTTLVAFGVERIGHRIGTEEFVWVIVEGWRAVTAGKFCTEPILVHTVTGVAAIVSFFGFSIVANRIAFAE